MYGKPIILNKNTENFVLNDIQNYLNAYALKFGQVWYKKKNFQSHYIKNMENISFDRIQSLVLNNFFLIYLTNKENLLG